MDLKNPGTISTGPCSMDYNWRDTALYTLAVGAGPEELAYIYEKDMKTIPTFGTTPCWNTVNVLPKRPATRPAAFILREMLEQEDGGTVRGLHMEHRFVMYRPIDPIKGILLFEDRITRIYDRGVGKGIVAESQMPVYDEAGNLICENIARTVFFTHGGFGGEAPEKSRVIIPDRSPDLTADAELPATANMLYRLTGDTSRVHADPEEAAREGFDRPFMQGLCSFGYACRLAIGALIPGAPERMREISAQMRSVCFPGSKLRMEIWKEGRGRAVFRLVNAEDGKAVLDRGVFLYRE